MPDAVLLFTGLVVFAQMVDIGLRQDPGDLPRLWRQPGLLLRSLVSVLIVVPLAVVALVAALPLPPEVALGLVLLAAAPGAPLTTRRSEAAAADRAYVAALQLTLAALAVVFTPAIIAVSGLVTGPAVAPAAVARQIVLVTFVPAALGWLFARFAPAVLRRHAGLLSMAAKGLFVAFLLVVVLALVVVPDLRGTMLIGWAGAAAAVVLALVALVAGHLLGGPRTERRAGLAVATVARNLGLALYIAEGSPETAVAIPTILTYAVLALLLAVPYSRWIGRWSAREKGEAGRE